MSIFSAQVVFLGWPVGFAVSTGADATARKKMNAVFGMPSTKRQIAYMPETAETATKKGPEDGDRAEGKRNRGIGAVVSGC